MSDFTELVYEETFEPTEGILLFCDVTTVEGKSLVSHVFMMIVNNF